MSWPWFSSLFLFNRSYQSFSLSSQRATGFLFCTGAYIGALFLHFDHSFGIQDFWTVFSMTSSSPPCLVWVLQVWLWLDFLNAERASLIVACNDCCVVFATSTPSHLPLQAIMILFVYNGWDYDRFVLICFQDHDTADTYGMIEELRPPWFIKPNKEEPSWII
jgi:hypothetical protein